MELSQSVMTLTDHWKEETCTEQMQTAPRTERCGQLVADCGETTLRIHRDIELETSFAAGELDRRGVWRCAHESRHSTCLQDNHVTRPNSTHARVGVQITFVGHGKTPTVRQRPDGKVVGSQQSATWCTYMVAEQLLAHLTATPNTTHDRHDSYTLNAHVAVWTRVD